MEKFLRDNRVKRGANLKLNLKPTGIQAIARSKLKLKRSAEDDSELEQKNKRRQVLKSKLRLNDPWARDHEEKYKVQEESLEELIEDYESQSQEDMEDTIEKSLSVDHRTDSSSLSISRYNVCQIKNLELNHTYEDSRSLKNSWKRVKFKEVSKDKVSLCNRLLYAKQIVIEKEPVKEEEITFTIISTRIEFGWRIVRTQFIDLAVKLQDSRDLQIGGNITVTIPCDRKLRDVIFISDPKKIKLENEFRGVTNGVTPVQVSNRFQAGCSDFSVTIQRKADFRPGHPNRRFLVTDAVGNYAFLEIDLEHHDLQRILAYGEGQKIIISSVEASCSYMTTRSPMEISLVDCFSHGSRIKFDLTFNDYSRCKLPLDDTNSSKLNLVSKDKGILDNHFYSEDYISSEQNKFKRIIPNGRTNIKIKVLLNFSKYNYYVYNNQRIFRVRVAINENDQLEQGAYYSITSGHLTSGKVLVIDEWTSIDQFIPQIEFKMPILPYLSLKSDMYDLVQLSGVFFKQKPSKNGILFKNIHRKTDSSNTNNENITVLISNLYQTSLNGIELNSLEPLEHEIKSRFNALIISKTGRIKLAPVELN